MSYKDLSIAVFNGIDHDRRIKYLETRIKEYEGGNKKTMHYGKTAYEMQDYNLDKAVLAYYKTKRGT